MNKIMQSLIFGAIILVLACGMNDARPQSSAAENNQEIEAVEPDVDDLRNAYYELPAQSVYPNAMPLDRLQMLIAQYRPSAYLRTPGWNSVNDLYRLPESKRQVRYRQCYFNPISCFKK